jgi:hypothetical protein
LKWKSKLISSSLPLEFEAAKILVAKGFTISSDFSYARNDAGVVKDFSVDLHAMAYLPFSNPQNISSTAKLELLVECKQRLKDISWLFLPSHRPFFAYNDFGYALCAEDQFSQLFFPYHATAYFEKPMCFCYKGTEIDEKNGSVYDAELKHGIAQLQYALPRLYVERVLEDIRYDYATRPFLFCSILVTTANLFVAHESLVTADVEKSSSLKDIAHQVPYLIFISDYGPDFKSHCLEEFAPLAELPNNKIIKILDGYRKKHISNKNQLPSALATSLAEGERSQLYSRFTHFVICNMQHFPSLMTHLKRSTTTAVRNLKQLPKL